MDISCFTCKNTNCFIKYCSSDAIKRIDTEKSISIFNKGQYLFREGNLVDGISIIHSGIVKVFNTGYNNKIQAIRFAKDGFIVGHRSIGKKYFSISVSVIEKSTVCFIDNELFYEILLKENCLTFNLMLFFAEELRSAENRMKTLSQMTVREKAIESLLLASKMFGEKIEFQNKILINADLSKTDYSEIAGIRVEQFAKELNKLKSAGLIHLSDQKKIIIDNIHHLQQEIATYYTNRFELI